MVAVNPKASELEGRPCYASVREVEPPPDGVLVMTPARETDRVARDCYAAGVKRIWMYRATGTGAVSATALRFCHDNGIQAIAGECPYMFLPDCGFLHNLHGWLRTAMHPELRQS